MDVAVLGVMIPIIAIAGTVIVIIYLRKYQNQERMAMIEKSLSPDLFKSHDQVNPSVTLRFSLLLIGLGVGILLGFALDRSFGMDEVGYFSMLFILGGIGLGIAYIIEEKKHRSNKL